MTDGASYAFLSMLRRGLAALIQPGTSAGDPRVGVPVTLSAGSSLRARSSLARSRRPGVAPRVRSERWASVRAARQARFPRRHRGCWRA